MLKKSLVLAAVAATTITLVGCGQSAPNQAEAKAAFSTYMSDALTQQVGTGAKGKTEQFTLKQCKETKTKGQYDCGYSVKYKATLNYGGFNQDKEFKADVKSGLVLQQNNKGKWVVVSLQGKN